ncbi:hypothetical protein J2Z47_005599 [Cohnella thailandensis]|nr:hypothetical protein [Cohnella thailandensis]
MYYLIGLVIIVIAAAAVATILIGHSSENKREHTGYGRGTTRKWRRLLVIYVLGTLLVLVAFLLLLTR